MEGGNIMNAVEISSVLSGEDAHDGGGEGGGFGEVGVMEDIPEEPFAGERHEDGAVSHAQGGQVADECQVVLRCFAETDAGVQADAGRGDAGSLSQGESLFKERAHLCHDIGIGWCNLHGLRVALHVHEDDAAGVCGAKGTHFCRFKAGDVVNDVCPCCQGCCSNGGVAGVYGDECVGEFSANGRDNGCGAAFFFRRGYRGSPWAGGLAANVDDMGALVKHEAGMLKGGGDGVVAATVGEGVGGDVENAHDTAGCGDFPRLMAQLPSKG